MNSALQQVDCAIGVILLFLYLWNTYDLTSLVKFYIELQIAFVVPAGNCIKARENRQSAVTMVRKGLGVFHE